MEDKTAPPLSLQAAAANYRNAVERYRAAQAAVKAASNAARAYADPDACPELDAACDASDNARATMHAAGQVLLDAAAVTIPPAEMPPCDLDDRASIVAFLESLASAFEGPEADLTRTLAAQVARGDDRRGGQ